MADVRKEVHEEIDRMTEDEVAELQKYLATYPSSLAAAIQNAPYGGELEKEEERLAVEGDLDWLEQNGGKGIPHEEVMRERGLRWPGPVAGR